MRRCGQQVLIRVISHSPGACKEGPDEKDDGSNPVDVGAVASTAASGAAAELAA